MSMPGESGSSPMMIAVDGAELFRVVARRKLVAILTAALVVIGGVLFLILQPRTYESSASVALLPAAELRHARLLRRDRHQAAPPVRQQGPQPVVP